MTNEQKATEIANEVAQETDYKDTAAYEAAIKMAIWKDEQYKILLDAKDQSIIQTEMDKNEEIQKLKDEILSKLVDLSIWKNNRPISKLGGWHTEPPTEDGCYLAETFRIPYKNCHYIVAEYDTNAQTWYDEAYENEIEIKRWKRI